MAKSKAKKGDVYGKLTLAKKAEKTGSNGWKWLCECECGKETVVYLKNMRNGHTKSCGCISREKASKRMTTHGSAETIEYNIWSCMKGRCSNKKNSEYKNYGGRGIIVCKRWLRFENFFEDMGNIPKDKSIDRIDNDGNYEPGNCRWATKIEQANNTRVNVFIEYEGKRFTVAQWSRRLGIKDKTIYKRLKAGWNARRALAV